MKPLLTTVAAVFCAAAFAETAYVPKSRYLDLMAHAVDAYTPQQVNDYIEETEKGWIREHGFARLTANIGILVAHGRRREWQGLFARMMDICCAQIPTARLRSGYAAGNDFAVKEIVLCLHEVSRAGIFPPERIGRWRAALAAIEPEKAYSCQPRVGSARAHNWCVYGIASEQARVWAGLKGDAAYVEKYAADQLRFFDANGMYKDPHQPMVYDMVTRLQYAVALHLGYDGPARAQLERFLEKSAEPTLAMLSASGEIPFGGRSNQFLHNETFYAALCEYYAAWYNRRGQRALAQRFRLAARRAVDALDYWLARRPVRHVKNAFPLKTRYGCEGYGYFNKYMVTMGSWAYLAFLTMDETLPEPDAAVREAAERPFVFEMGPAFHRTLLSAGGYSAQFDTAADAAYDASGLGRLQKRGAPPPLALSVPFPQHPKYKLDMTNETPLAIMPGWRTAAGWRYAYAPRYVRKEQAADKDHARISYTVHEEGAALAWETRLCGKGLSMRLSGADELAFTVPAFVFDGARQTRVTVAPGTLTVTFDGWTCRYTTSGAFCDTQRVYGNRNGHYRRYEARGKAPLTLKAEIFKQH